MQITFWIPRTAYNHSKQNQTAPFIGLFIVVDMDLKTFKMYSVSGMGLESRPKTFSPTAKRKQSLSKPLKKKTSLPELIRQNSVTDTSLSYQSQYLSIIVVGASGDLAKKKTYPSLFQLFTQGFLVSKNFSICGYARSSFTNESFKEKIRAALSKKFKGKGYDNAIEDFLAHCRYSTGTAYNDVDAWTSLNEVQMNIEGNNEVVNRLFYFALPPSQFAPAAAAITKVSQTKKGWSK
jgi:hypothetical protein